MLFSSIKFAIIIKFSFIIYQILEFKLILLSCIGATVK